MIAMEILKINVAFVIPIHQMIVYIELEFKLALEFALEFSFALALALELELNLHPNRSEGACPDLLRLFYYTV